MITKTFLMNAGIIGSKNLKTSVLLLILFLTQCSAPVSEEFKWPDKIRTILDNTKVLKYGNENRLPLYLWPAIDPGVSGSDMAERLVLELGRRGIGVVCSWRMADTSKVFSQCLPIARAQKKLGQRINIDATDLLNAFFNGDEATAHTDADGKPFFDSSFGDHKMGCPFTLDARKDEIRKRVEVFVNRYKKEGLSVDFIFTDWEIDGPLEVNRAFEASKKCERCCKNLGRDFTFPDFQKKMREMRAYLQRYSYSEPVLLQFPDALVGNYAVYPNDGYRYWYDYFEYYVEGQPFIADQKAKYRKWYNDFPLTGFTFAMPVIYTWSGLFGWYDFDNSDYRWFYNMLLNAGNAGKSTPGSIPVISFVHWHTIFEGGGTDSTVKQMSSDCYQELLWHMLLRGTDAFFMWCMKDENPEEVRLLHEVYADAQKYGKFLDNGIPITFDLPCKPGTVISGLALGDSVLIRRTDFDQNHGDVQVLAGTKLITVEYSPGQCNVIGLK
jgi:hypothetical protein